MCRGDGAITKAEIGFAIEVHLLLIFLAKFSQNIELTKKEVGPLPCPQFLEGRCKILRKNAVNGLAVVTIDRDSCSGCFNQIPPQRQLDIRQRKKVIVCEHCGRILVDEALTQELAEA